MKQLIYFGLLISILFCYSTYAVSNENLAKAIALFDDKKYDEARDLLEDIVDEDESNAQAHFYLGRSNMALREFDDASENFEEAVELEVGNAEYHFWLAQAYAGDAQNSSFISAAFIAPKIKDEFAKTIEIDPSHIGGHVGLANFHLNAPGIVGGDIDEVPKVLESLIKLDEKRGRFLLVNYHMKKENYDSVETQIKSLEDKFGEDKDFASFYNSYGYLLLQHEKYQEALVYFKKQVDLRPDNANSYDSLGDGYRALGNLEEAAVNYRKALEIDPNFEASINNLEEIEELLSK